MKTRRGFVSNSSSSSFIAVMVEDGQALINIWEQLGLPEDWYCDDLCEQKIQEWGYGTYKIGDSLMLYESEGRYGSKVAIDIEDLLKANKTVEECKQLLQETVEKRFGIKVPTDKIAFCYGEWSGG